MREQLKKHGINVPKYHLVTNIDELEAINLSLPAIVKPIDSGGSRGITKLIKIKNIAEAFQRAVSFSKSKKVLIEEFIGGREFSVEYISHRGKHYFVTITDKVTTEHPYFVELEHHQAANISKENIEKIKLITEHTLDALKIHSSASHTEVKMNENGEVYIIEVGARMGGDFITSDLVKLSTGYDFVKGAIELATGDFKIPEINVNKFSGIYYLSKETAHLLPYIKEQNKNPYIVQTKLWNTELTELKESNDRSGFLIYQSNQKYIPAKKNMKEFQEIGGNFWIKPSQENLATDLPFNFIFVEKNENKIYTASGRSAISLVIRNLEIKNGRVLLPAYTCSSVIQAFLNIGYKVKFYSVNLDFSVNEEELEKLAIDFKANLIFFQTYFGFDTLSNIRSKYQKFQDNGIIIIEDLTHSLLSDFKKTGANYYIASLRKWLEIPDGGVAISIDKKLNCGHDSLREHRKIVNNFVEASKLKRLYIDNMDANLKPQFRSLFYEIEDILDKQQDVHKISNTSMSILTNVNIEDIKRKRWDNYQYLVNKISNIKWLNPVFPKIKKGLTPLYLAVLVKSDRNQFQKHLASLNIYAPIIWPKPKELDLTHPDIEELYSSLLAIPCDQRYNLEDMARIYSEIELFN